MAFSITYRPLFQVNILHNYFLSDGTGDTIESDLLAKYDARGFVDLIPTDQTISILKGHKMVFKKQAEGFTVYIKVSGDTGILERTPFIDVIHELQLTFVIKVIDPLFWNYTDLPFKGNLFYFGNVRPTTEPVSLSFIPISSSTDLIDSTSSFRLSDDGDEDVRDAHGAALNGAMGVIQLSMRGNDSIITLADNLILADHRVFKLHFRNRSTTWKYINSSDDTTILTTGPHQLTRFGSIDIINGSDRLPNASAAIPINSSNESEIYI